jgi:hypothetical protein
LGKWRKGRRQSGRWRVKNKTAAASPNNNDEQQKKNIAERRVLEKFHYYTLL